jgi:hypothetical protein
MKRCLLLAMLWTVFLGQVFAQSTADDEVNGSVEDGVYANDRYGFTINVPQGWQVTPEENRQKFETELNAKGGSDLRAMLAMHRPGSAQPGGLPDIILITGLQFRNGGGVSFNAAMNFLKGAPKSKEMRVIMPPDSFLFGGLLVAREDFQASPKDKGPERFMAHLAIVIRDRLISFQVNSSTRDGVEQGVKELAAATEFHPDWVAKPSPPATNGNDVNGGGTKIDSASGYTPDPRVRLSQASLMSLLEKKVPPELPDSMTEDSIKVPVQMHLLISSSGAVEKIWVFEGDSNLTWPAVAAVRQWRFRPYMVNQKPVPIESTITVDFQ